MKYQRKKFKSRMGIDSEYGMCKVLYLDKYNTILHRRPYVKVKCKNCGNIVTKSVSRMKDTVKRGFPNTCGCIVKSQDGDNIKGKRNRLYSIWQNIIGRCECDKSPTYKYYGGRGITICDEWRHNYKAFKDWALSHGYNDKLTIDRIDVNGNYEPNNCRWVDKSEQARNKRNNVNITINGITMCAQDWCDKYNLNRNTFNKRIARGWDYETAITTPAKENTLYDIDGVEKPLSAWCKEYNMCTQTVLYRLSQNWDLKTALTKPSKRKNHYSQYTYELKDVAPVLLSNLNGIDAVYIFNILKYVWRYEFKNGSSDIKKALEYARFLLEVLKSE